ncbi:hypothetical protein KC878_02720 [Candidatus Saccharibacteria bacterium]|nr:hypothetical protein [Candidatus Saccharibacteria bacterium]MCB9821279.1 hypothetical protein [Candidatus Nomurabacteria bacterium]
MNDESMKWQPMPVDKSITEPLEPLVKGWVDQVRAELPGIPDTVTWEWDNNQLMEDYGCGGATVTPSLLHLSFAPEFADKALQMQALEATIKHEMFHIAQGWAMFESKYTNATDMVSQAIMEGAACVYERETTGRPVDYAMPLVGENPDAMFAMLQTLPKELSWDDWRKYKFYDPESGRKWIVYKAGVWFIDQVLAKNPNLKIQDLAHMTPQEILALT